jgi:hypothetical protein
MATEIRAPYQYSSLHSPKAIRVVKILDRDLDGIPCCSLSEIQLDSQTEYITLSYTWGSPSKEATERGITADRCEQIICEDGIIPVTGNLLHFLQDARQFHRHLLDASIWIDAVCIDQDDPDERAAQVQMMDKIYIQAMAVVIWLGREEPTTHLALELLNFIENVEIPTRETRILDGQPLSHFLGPFSDSAEHWKALELMMHRTWFARTWVLQEFCLAAEFSFLCGKHTIAIKKLEKAALLSLQLPTSQPSRFVGLPGIKMGDILTLKRCMKESTRGNLLNILVHAQLCSATDPKDKVYGILGMIKHSVSKTSPFHSMEVNYRLSTVEIYTKFTRMLLSEKPSLMLFQNHNPRIHTSPAFLSELPSWVPDYTSGTNLTHGNGALRLSNVAAKGLPPSPLILRRPDGLVLNAQKVDIIEETVYISSDETEIPRIFGALPDILGFISTFEPLYFDAQPRTQALWCTLLANQAANDMREANPDHLETLRRIFGLWVGQCLFTLATKRSNGPEEYFNKYCDILLDLGEPIKTLAQTDDDFPSLNQLADIPRYLASADSELSYAMKRFSQAMQAMANMLTPLLFRTGKGFLGKCTSNSQVGDEVWLIAGMPTPVVLRKVDGENYFTKVDIAYVHGIMRGEYIERNGLQTEEIELI